MEVSEKTYCNNICPTIRDHCCDLNSLVVRDKARKELKDAKMLHKLKGKAESGVFVFLY